MKIIKAIFSWLGKFLERARVIILNVGTAFVLILLTLGIFGLFSSSQKPIDPSGKVVILDPDVLVTDEESFSESLFPATNINQMTFRDLKNLIEKLSDDKSIAGVLVDFSSTGFAGPTTLMNVAKLMKTLKESGKEIIAFSESYSTSSYLLSTYANEIWAHSAGSFQLRGFGGKQPYINELTQKLKFTIHDFSQGTFKSANETLTRNNMSEFERKQTEELINPLWENIKDIIASQKKFSSDDIQYFSDNFYTIFSENEYINLEFAQENGFITGVKSYPEFRSHMIDKFGKDMASSRDTYPNISYKEYMTTYEDKDKSSENQIAVISIEGVIMRGEIEPGIAGADGIAKLIRNAHENKKVKSIVIRVNSPGGGVTASEIIRDEIIAAKSKGKNIVVSMGDVAASGGVWVSTPAEYIFAESTTITGSIGVAVAFPTFENVMDYIGINFDGITTTKNAGWNEFQEMEPEIKDSVMKTSKRVYDRFVEVVAESRNESEEYIKSIAEGRVWIGSKALELNLVDGIGGIEDAISKAADLSNLSEYETIYYRKYLDPQTQLIKDLIEEFDIKIFDQKTVNAFQSINEVLSELDFVKEPTAILTCEVCQIKLY